MFESVEGKNKNNSFHLFGKQEKQTLKKETISFKQKFNYNKNETPFKLLDSMAALLNVNSTVVHQQVLITNSIVSYF
jgi:hypothetical protein